MELLDGKLVSSSIKNALKEEVNKIVEQYNMCPHLTIIEVGSVEASKIYVRNKIKACKLVGIDVDVKLLEESITTEELVNLIDSLNKDDKVDGILVQLPLPKHVDENRIINAIEDNKDVDGFTIQNKGKLFIGLPSFRSATPYGIIKLLEYYNINIQGMNAVVIGRSNIVGKPMAMMLLEKNATVTICHSKTKNLKEITSKADLVVAAIGKAKFITEDMIKEGAVVVDVGMNRTEEGLCGDVDFENVSKKASFITPVPGGVGPLTIAMLLNNCVEAFYLNHKELK